MGFLLDPVGWARVRGAAALLALAFLSLVSPSRAEEPLHGIALVVGQSDYRSLGALTNPANDAKAINTLLTNLGFEVDLVTNADRKKLAKALDRFVEDAADADVALIYYSGHGIEAGGENFLVPVDADVSALDRAGETLVPVSKVLARLQASVPITIILLDACRSSPFPAGATIKVDGGSTPVEVSPAGLGTPRGAVALGGGDQGGNGKGLGVVIGFAAAPGHVALDGDANGNSPYAAALLKHFAAPGFAFADVMTMVTEEVYLATGARQTPWTNASLRRLLYFGSTGENDTDGDETAIRGERRKLLLTISTLGDVERSQVAATAKSGGVPMDALFAMLKAIGADTPKDPDQLATLLQEQSQRLKALLDDRAVLSNPDPEIARLTDLANRAVQQGALEAAISLRERAKDRVASLAPTIEQTENELRTKHTEFAAVFADSGQTYALAGDAEHAAEDFGKAHDEVAKWDDALAAQYKLNQAEALSELGFYQADADATRRAIAAYQDVARLAPADKNPEVWAESQRRLATTLWTAGQQSSDTAALDQAASVLKAAITSPSLADRPQQIAQLKARLALVLLSLGQRSTGTDEFEEAERNARDALQVTTRVAAPDEWARVQNNLGWVLYQHAMRDPSSERFEQAEAAFRSALQVWTRENDPLSWAFAENNLGVVIGRLGQRNADVGQIEESIGHINAALEVRTREIAPMAWAEAMGDLGGRYIDVAKLSANPDLFDEGVAAFRAAAEEITRERDPLRWATLEQNIGTALSAKAAAIGRPEPLEEALAAFDEALKEQAREKVPLAWAQTVNGIGNAYYRLGDFIQNADAYRAAADAFSQALEVFTREETPDDWARAQNNLANALSKVGEREQGIDSLSAAVEHYQMALEAYTVDENPAAYAETQYNLALALLDIAARTGSQEALDATRQAAKASHDVYAAAGQSQYDRYFEQIEANVDALQAEIDKHKHGKKRKAK
jgi:uncharacterized caspase-like protein